MAQTVTAVQAPVALGRIDGHTNYASYQFIVANGVTINAGDFVYFASGYITSATITGDSRPIGLSESTVVGDGTKTAVVLVDPMMLYLIKGSSAFSQSHVGTYFDLQGATGAQLVNTGSSSATTGVVVCVAVGPDPRIGGHEAGVNTSSYGIFKLVESALSPLGA